MSKTDAWMPLWIGAYLADTQHLSRDEHGAYLLLIMAYWRGGAPLPDDDKRLASIVKAGLREWKTLRPVLAEFFVVGDGLWRHKRIDRELLAAGEKKQNQHERAKTAANLRWKGAQSNASGNASSNASRMPQAMLEQCPTPTPTPTPECGEEGARARATLAVELHKLGVNITPASPYLAAWLQEGYSTGAIMAALEIARLSKPVPATMPAKYLDTVLRSPQAAPKRKRSLHDERAATIAELTGASRPAPEPAAAPASTEVGAEREPIESAARRVG